MALPVNRAWGAKTGVGCQNWVRLQRRAVIPAVARIYSLMEDAGWHSLRKLLKLEHAASRKLPLREENSLVTDPAAEPETVHGRCVRYSCMPLACHEGLQGSTTPLPDVLLWCPAPAVTRAGRNLRH